MTKPEDLVTKGAAAAAAAIREDKLRFLACTLKNDFVIAFRGMKEAKHVFESLRALASLPDYNVLNAHPSDIVNLYQGKLSSAQEEDFTLIDIEVYHFIPERLTDFISNRDPSQAEIEEAKRIFRDFAKYESIKIPLLPLKGMMVFELEVFLAAANRFLLAAKINPSPAFYITEPELEVALEKAYADLFPGLTHSFPDIQVAIGMQPANGKSSVPIILPPSDSKERGPH